MSNSNGGAYSLRKKLEDRYEEILMPYDELLKSKGLSEIFLTSIADESLHSKRRIMIVGREPGGNKGWHWGKNWDGSIFPKDICAPLRSYIHEAMQYQQEVTFKSFSQIKNDKGGSFHNFLRMAAKLSESHNDEIVYSNLFCYSTGKGEWPYDHARYKEIKYLSKELLKAQISILNPHIVVFANGKSSAHLLNDFLDLDRNDALIGADKFFSEFKSRMFENIKFYITTYHPSYRRFTSKIKKQVLEKILNPAI